MEQYNSYLAPMMSISDNPGFLYLCKKYKCEILVLPMIFLEHMKSNPSFLKRKLLMLEQLKEYFNLGSYILQIIGQDTTDLKQSLELIASHDVSGINLNLGCPSHKISKFGLGASMLERPKQRDNLIESILKITPLPFSIKMRLMGTKKPDLDRSIAFCKVLDERDIDWIAIHGRTMEQGYTGSADWNAIHSVHDIIETRVIGNGDLNSAREGYDRIDKGYCDGFMIGRAAVKNPKIFDPTEPFGKRDLKDVLELFIDYKLFLESLPKKWGKDYLSFHEIRRWLYFFSRGVHNGKKLRKRLNNAQDIAELEEILKNFSMNLV